jgi:hypothetical protein
MWLDTQRQINWHQNSILLWIIQTKCVISVNCLILVLESTGGLKNKFKKKSQEFKVLY